MKPVVLEVLKNFPNISALELANAFGYSKDFGNFKESIFRKFFEGASFGTIKKLMKRTDFDSNNLQEFVKEYRDDTKIEGFSKEQWINWLIKDVPNLTICKKIGCNPKDSHSATNSINWILNNSEIGMSKRDAVKYFRRLRTIEHKLKGRSLKWIYTVIFGLKVDKDWSIRRFHDRLWDSIITFDSLNDMSNPNELLNLKLDIS